MDISARRRADSLHQKGSPQERCMVTCRLQRNTFLPGEQVRGTIKFAVSSEDQESVDVEEATVQAHGYVKVDPRWIALPASLRSLFRQETAAADEAQTKADQGVLIPRYSGLADDRSACVFASEVAVLLKKDRVASGDPASFRFSLVLPEKLIPSFKGVGVRYAYAITVRVRRALPPAPAAGRLLGLVRRRTAAGSSASAGFSTTDVHVAFTVLSEGPDVATAAEAGAGTAARVPGGVGVIADGAGQVIGEGSGCGGVPFAELEAERQSKDAFRLEADRAKAGGLVSGTRAVTWNMQAEFCAGDIVLGNFDFSEASTRCLQVCACLEVCEENKAVFSGDPAQKASGSGKNTCHKRVVDASKELTPCLIQSSVTLSLPMDAPVSFSTELVSISWSLRFEFVMAPPESRWNLGGALSPSRASVLKWAVPIRVVPPRRAALGGGGRRELAFNAMDATGRAVLC
eukprot:g16307.t1